MTRNGAIAGTIRSAFTSRLAPITGVSLKMLVYQLQRQGTAISDDTLVRYREDVTVVPGWALGAIDKAFAHYGYPGFLSEAHGCPVLGRPASRQSPSLAPLAEADGEADACWWATPDGIVHRARFGHTDFARRYLELPHDTDADPRRYAINHLGWLALTRYSDGRLQLEGNTPRDATTRERVAAWLEQRASAIVAGGPLPQAVTCAEAAAFLRACDMQPAASEWSTRPINPDRLTDAQTRALWAAIHDAGIERAHLVEIAGTMKMLDRCSLFIVDGDDVVSASLGSSLPVDRTVVGRNVLGRRDLAYARELRAGILSARARPASMRVSLRGKAGVVGGYDRSVWAQPIGRDRWQVMAASTGHTIPANFETLR